MILTYEQGLSELHSDVGLARKLMNGRRQEINLETCQFHIDFSFYIVPFIIVERFRRAQSHVSNPITHHENEYHLSCSCENLSRNG